MKDYAIKFAPGWYDIPIDYLLSSLGDVLRDDFERDMCAHYGSMMDLEQGKWQTWQSTSAP